VFASRWVLIINSLQIQSKITKMVMLLILIGNLTQFYNAVIGMTLAANTINKYKFNYD
jgi:hypothetical protein